MTHDEFLRIVREMRRRQINYFKTRCGDDLDFAKKAEKQVDAAIKEILTKSYQPTLFQEDAHGSSSQVEKK